MSSWQIGNAGFTFLVSDLELALTFTRIATNSVRNANRRERNQRNARRAYDSVQKLAAGALLTEDQRDELDATTARLKSELENLGEIF